jgi:cytidyltransferase-like protein
VADLFHYGHVNFLRTARKHGDYLLVEIHSDEVVRTYKRAPVLSMDERIAVSLFEPRSGRSASQ